jgi:hypothetical protein
VLRGFKGLDFERGFMMVRVMIERTMSLWTVEFRDFGVSIVLLGLDTFTTVLLSVLVHMGA